MEKKVRSFQIMLSAMVILAFLAMPFTVNAQAGKANFSGTWAMNAEKSTLPQGTGGQGSGMRMGGNFTVTQDANVLTQSRTGQDGTVREPNTLSMGKKL